MKHGQHDNAPFLGKKENGIGKAADSDTSSFTVRDWKTRWILPRQFNCAVYFGNKLCSKTW